MNISMLDYQNWVNEKRKLFKFEMSVSITHRPENFGRDHKTITCCSYVNPSIQHPRERIWLFSSTLDLKIFEAWVYKEEREWK